MKAKNQPFKNMPLTDYFRTAFIPPRKVVPSNVSNSMEVPEVRTVRTEGVTLFKNWKRYFQSLSVSNEKIRKGGQI